jgi:hypothetical protein
VQVTGDWQLQHVYIHGQTVLRGEEKVKVIGETEKRGGPKLT